MTDRHSLYKAFRTPVDNSQRVADFAEVLNFSGFFFNESEGY